MNAPTGPAPALSGYAEADPAPEDAAMTSTPVSPRPLTAAEVDALYEHAEDLCEAAFKAAAAVAAVCVRAIAARVRLAHPTATLVHLVSLDGGHDVTVQGWSTGESPAIRQPVDPAISEAVNGLADGYALTGEAVVWAVAQTTGCIDIDQAMTEIDPNALAQAPRDAAQYLEGTR